VQFLKPTSHRTLCYFPRRQSFNPTLVALCAGQGPIGYRGPPPSRWLRTLHRAKVISSHTKYKQFRRTQNSADPGSDEDAVNRIITSS